MSRRLLRATAAVALLLVAWWIASKSADGQDLTLSAWRVALAVALMFVNTCLAPLRLSILTRAFNHRLELRQSALAISAGFAASAIGLSIAGQAGGAIAVMRASGIPVYRSAIIFAVERSIGLLVLGGLGAGAALLLLGAPVHPALVIAGAGILLAIIIAVAPDVLDEAERVQVDLRLVGMATMMTLLMHGACLMAWVVLLCNGHCGAVAASAVLVMLVSSIPLGWAGFGPREVAAVSIMAGVGVSAGDALGASISIGLGSIAAITAVGMFALWAQD